MVLMSLSLGYAVVSADGFNLMVLPLGCIVVSSNGVNLMAVFGIPVLSADGADLVH